MSYIEFKTIPRIYFAHTFRTKNYANIVSPAENSLEITLFLAGETEITINGQTFTASAGDFILNPLSHPATVTCVGEHEHHTVRFEAVFSQFELPTLVRCPSDRAQNVYTLCKSLLNETIRCYTMYPDKTLRQTALLFQLLDNLDQLISFSEDSPHVSPYIARIKNYIFEHIHEPIKQSEIAAHLNITPEYLCSVFKQCEGMSIVPYIHTIKLRNIELVIKKEGLSLRKASERYGYPDPNYVSRLYKKLFGCTISSVTQEKQLSKSSWNP